MRAMLQRSGSGRRRLTMYSVRVSSQGPNSRSRRASISFGSNVASTIPGKYTSTRSTAPWRRMNSSPGGAVPTPEEIMAAVHQALGNGG